MLRRPDARIDWTKPAVEIWRAIRAYNPWPVAFTVAGGEELRVLEAWPLQGDSASEPGTVLAPGPLPEEAGSRDPAPLVQTGEGRLALVTVQRAGKKALAGQVFLRGQREFQGSRLG
jgi:methionyl-tRNA formyltransferase